LLNLEQAVGGLSASSRGQTYIASVQGEAATSDTVAAESFPRELVKIIDDGGYTKDEIFNVDEMGLFWKKLSSRIFIAEEEKTMPVFKPAKDRLTFPLGVSAYGTLLEV
jgi:hypothetical protein